MQSGKNAKSDSVNESKESESAKIEPQLTQENDASADAAERIQANAEDSIGGEHDVDSKSLKELNTIKDQNTRLLADFENFRRRVARERSETYQRAAESIFSEFLPFYDDFARALSQAPDPGKEPFADGVRLLFDKLKNIFSKNNVEPFDACGKQFNPNDHEAIAYRPAPNTDEGEIIYQTLCGFKMSDKVIRPASVIVSSGETQENEPDNAETPLSDVSEE